MEIAVVALFDGWRWLHIICVILCASIEEMSKFSSDCRKFYSGIVFFEIAIFKESTFLLKVIILNQILDLNIPEELETDKR